MSEIFIKTRTIINQAPTPLPHLQRLPRWKLPAMPLDQRRVTASLVTVVVPGFSHESREAGITGHKDYQERMEARCIDRPETEGATGECRPPTPPQPEPP